MFEVSLCAQAKALESVIISTSNKAGKRGHDEFLKLTVKLVFLFLKKVAAY